MLSTALRFRACRCFDRLFHIKLGLTTMTIDCLIDSTASFAGTLIDAFDATECFTGLPLFV
jgi:hypothetical protein